MYQHSKVINYHSSHCSVWNTIMVLQSCFKIFFSFFFLFCFWCLKFSVYSEMCYRKTVVYGNKCKRNAKINNIPCYLCTYLNISLLLLSYRRPTSFYNVNQCQPFSNYKWPGSGIQKLIGAKTGCCPAYHISTRQSQIRNWEQWWERAVR